MVITGVGIVSPIGIGKEIFWKNLVEGKTGIDRISLFDASSFPSQIAGEVRDFEPRAFLNEKQISYYSRATQFAFAAARLAKADAGIKCFDPMRTDVVIGAGASSFEFVDEQVFRNPYAGRAYVAGTFDPRGIAKYSINLPACAIAFAEQIRGYTVTLSTACASGLTAIGTAMERITSGLSDVAIAGAADCAVNHFTLNLFSAADFLNTQNDCPDTALCPFDRRHTKSVLAEGAGIFVFEELAHALDRGAPIYAELSEFSQQYENQNEFFGMDKSGKRWSETILAVTKNGKILPEYVNAHGTSDRQMDIIETSALMHAFGERAAQIPVSSIKGNIGSPFGAAGALQLATAALAIHKKELPPNYNYRMPDPECNLRLDSFRPRTKIKNALVNSHGFGGVNASLFVRELVA
ncbi:MAG: beta-ketoacyl-[acyl-carrier-protein] synthase family protein [Deltaproteobacteria bacterium]|nr:beta-ketoacyl-[acyl-carrier-protein] synthase family protein [Deltaproteobacteria bacterium]